LSQNSTQNSARFPAAPPWVVWFLVVFELKTHS